MRSTEASTRHVLESLDNLPRLLTDAAEYAANAAQDYFRDDDALNRSLAAEIFRYRCLEYMKANAWKVPRCFFDRLPNNGISFHYKGHHMRVWKRLGQTDRLPRPGHSASKSAFLRQQPPPQALQLDMLDMLGLQREPWCDNLIVFWDVDSDYQLCGLRLARPAADPSGTADIRADWVISLEHPVMIMDQKTREAISLEDVSDLPLEAIDDEVKTGAKPEGERGPNQASS